MDRSGGDLEPETLCRCGSGVRQLRCCDATAAAIIAPERAAALASLASCAQAAHDAGQQDVAAALCRDVLEQQPFHIEALLTLYAVRCQTGPESAAHALIERVGAIDPNHFWAAHQRGVLALGRGAIRLAEHHARNAMRLAPRRAEAHALMAMLLSQQNDPVSSIAHSRQAMALRAEQRGAPDPFVMANLALNLRLVGQFDEARALFARSLELDPHRPRILVAWAQLEIDARQPDAAAAVLARAVAAGGETKWTASIRVQLGELRGDLQGALAAIDAMMADATTAERVELILRKGRLLDRLGRPGEAWQHFVAGKELGRVETHKVFDGAMVENLTSRLAGFFTADRMATLPRARARGDLAQPIFIMGFPRSGTTLLETSLSMHPRIAAGDELHLIRGISNRLPALLQSPLTYPEALSELWMADRRREIDGLRDSYLRGVPMLDQLGEDLRWFIDKTPLNEMHIGLIALMFPQAPMLHLIRHPLDVVLSVYSHYLTHGFNCAFQLQTIAQLYAWTDQLVAHYGAELRPRYRAVRYERLIEDQEGELRAVFDFLGEQFDPACLEFHRNARVARTASVTQVREQLYTRSCYRYRNYLSQLEPVIPILAPSIARLGYTV